MMRGKIGNLAVSLAVGLMSGLQSRFSRLLFNNAAAATISDVPTGRGAPQARPKVQQSKPRAGRVRRVLFRGNRYKPHQGAQECLRRRQGGNALRIRMERIGQVWNDHTRQYEEAT